MHDFTLDYIDCMDCKHDDPDDPNAIINYCAKCRRAYDPESKEGKQYPDNYKKKRGNRPCFPC